MTKHNPIPAHRKLGAEMAAVSRTRQDSVAAIGDQLDIGHYRSLAFRSGTPTTSGVAGSQPLAGQHYFHTADRSAPVVHQRDCNNPGLTGMEQCSVREQCSPGHLQVWPVSADRRTGCSRSALSACISASAHATKHPAQTEKVTYTYRPTNAVMQLH